MPARENIFVKWLKDKSKSKGLEIPKNTTGIFTTNKTHLPQNLQTLAKTILELGERDGELGIQALLLRLKGAERVNQQDLPYVHSALDTVVSSLGYENRNELIQFFAVPDVDRKTVYNPDEDQIFDEKMGEIYTAVLSTIQKVRPGIQVTLPRLAELAKSPKKFVEEVILAILEQKPVLGEYLQFEQVFIREEDTDELIDELIAQPIPRYGHFHCSHCQEIIENRSANTCPSCGEKVSRCIVCKLPISADDSIGKCSQCEGLAHLTHLQEWVKVKGKCPRCLQATKVVILKEAKPIQEEKLAFGIELSGIQIVNSGEWKDIPEGSTVDDVQGFFNMLFATNEKKLFLWRRNKLHSIGFFEHGKFFIHEMKLFDSVKEYLIATNVGLKTPESLQRYREARSFGWENYEIVDNIWEAINKRYSSIEYSYGHRAGEQFSFKYEIMRHPFIEEKYPELVYGLKSNSICYEILPPLDSDIIYGEDWFIWLLAYESGWESFKKLNDFARSVFPEFQELYKEWIERDVDRKNKQTKKRPFRDYYKLSQKMDPISYTRRKTHVTKKQEIYFSERYERFLKLLFLAIYGPFNANDDWLQGWPNFNSLMDFWTKKEDIHHFWNPNLNEYITVKKHLEKNILPMKIYPAIVPYDSSCKNSLDWIFWALAITNDWQSYKDVIELAAEKESEVRNSLNRFQDRDRKKWTDDVLKYIIIYEIANRRPLEASKMEIVVDLDYNKINFSS